MTAISAEILSASGGVIRLPVPRPGEISYLDAARALGNMCRCNGHTTPFFSVAQHSIEVASLAKSNAADFDVDPDEAFFAGLIHDWQEAYIGDIITPTKKQLGEPLYQLEAQVQRRVFEDLTVQCGFDVLRLFMRAQEVVNWADRQMVVADMIRWRVYGRILVGPDTVLDIRPGEIPDGYSVHFENSKPLGPTASQNMYIVAFSNSLEILKRKNYEQAG